MTELTQTLTDLATEALDASRVALTALEADVAPNLTDEQRALAEGLIGAIKSRAIFDADTITQVEDLLDDLAEHVLAGTIRTTRYDPYSVSGGTWVETRRSDKAAGFARASTELVDFLQALNAVHDRAEAERAVEQLLATA